MYEKLKELELRLSRAAGDVWLEANGYYFDVCHDCNDPHYLELSEREQILFDAWGEVKTALKVITEAQIA